MELTNEFEIDRPIDEAYGILNDLEFIAPCMPGAQLTEIEGEEYRGHVKVKVGPITAKYSGKASFASQDPASHTSVLNAAGRDPRQGNASAVITATMDEVTPTKTKVTIHTDMSLTGKVASFGRGAIEDVSTKILGQFSDNLEAKINEVGHSTVGDDASSDESATPEPTPVAAAPASASSGPTDSKPAETSKTSDDAPKVRKINAPPNEPVNILSVTGDSLTKRLAPLLAGALALVILRWLLKAKNN